MIKMDSSTRERLDVLNATLFFARQLEVIEAKAYEIKLPELKYRSLIPVNNQLNPGADTITYRMYGKVGMVKVIANYADDLPRCDAYAEEFSQVVKTLGAAVGYSTQELRSASFANTPLETAKVDSMRRAFRERESNICWNGDTATGIKGLISNPNIPSFGVPTGVGGYTWALKTADEIIADVTAMISRVRSQSKGIHNANTLVLPLAQYDIISTKPRSTHSDMTVLEYITKPGNKFGLTTVEWLPFELDNAFTGGTEDGAFCYEKDSANLELMIPLEMQMLPVQVKNLEFTIPAESRIGGVVVRYPLAMCFATGI